MKKRLLKIMLTAGIFIATNFFALSQTISTFDNLPLAPNSYWNGISTPHGTTFISGNAIFPNFYETNYGGYWASGWAYSNMQDSVTAGFLNMYSARPAIGYNNTLNYAVGQQEAVINLNSLSIGKVINGFYVTNTTFAAISMRDGDSYAKKFGGTNGNDPDWFKLTIRKWYSGLLTNDSIEFYLADYRFANNNQDYIVKNWQWVDLSSLGNVDSLKFSLSSSDVGPYGMNTPAFFCIDNFTTADSPLLSYENNGNSEMFSIFPNPASNYLSIDISQLTDKNVNLKIIDLSGKTLLFKTIYNNEQINVSDFKKGIYTLQILSNNLCITKKIVIQ